MPSWSWTWSDSHVLHSEMELEFSSWEGNHCTLLPAGCLLEMCSSIVVALRSRKQTHSEGQCRWWSAVYYTGGPKAEWPLSQGPQPVFVP